MYLLCKRLLFHSYCMKLCGRRDSQGNLADLEENVDFSDKEVHLRNNGKSVGMEVLSTKEIIKTFFKPLHASN